MRYVTFSLPTDPTPRLGAVRGDRVLDLTANGGPPSLLALIQAGPAQWQRAARRGRGVGRRRPCVDAVRLHAPIPRPLKNVFCLGLNYAAHAKESAQARGKRDQDSRHAGDLHEGADHRERPVRRRPGGPQRHAAGGLGGGARRRHRHAGQEHRAGPTRSATSSATPSSTTSAPATCRCSTASGSRARASTARARWARASSPPTSSAIRRPSGCSAASTASPSRTRRTAT